MVIWIPPIYSDYFWFTFGTFYLYMAFSHSELEDQNLFAAKSSFTKYRSKWPKFLHHGGSKVSWGKKTWLVGGFNPLKILVSWDDEIPSIWKNNKCSKPPTRWGTSAASESQSSHLCPQRAWWRHASAPHSGHGRRSERCHGSCFINPMERGQCLWKLKPHGWKSWFIYIPFGYLT